MPSLSGAALVFMGALILGLQFARFDVQMRPGKPCA